MFNVNLSISSTALDITKEGIDDSMLISFNSGEICRTPIPKQLLNSRFTGGEINLLLLLIKLREYEFLSHQ